MIFSSHTISLNVDSPASVYAADLDGDGDIDVLSASVNDDKIAWYENDGFQNFSTHNISINADGAFSVSALDIDGDGDLDVLAADYDNVSWYKNDGFQNFSLQMVTPNIGGISSVYPYDIDGDGFIDVLSSVHAGDKIIWHKNDGMQNFTNDTIDFNADGATSVYAEDLDGDGDIDVLSSTANNDQIIWYENDGTHNFNPTIISTNADNAQAVHTDDLDGDGDVDVVSASLFDHKIAWYENGYFSKTYLTECDSYTSPSGNYSWNLTGVYTDTIPSVTGCDSILIIDLTVNNTSVTGGTDVQSACLSYTWIDGVSYTSNNNTATYILPNTGGCDSLVTLDLTINSSSFGIDEQTVCDSYLWLDGVTYTANNNTATYILPNAVGCDSLVTLNLTITNSSSGTDVQTACNSYIWIDGATYTSSNNIATHTLSNAASCDSIVTLDLTINNVDNGITNNSPTLSANAVGANYQWLDCDNNYAEINGETVKVLLLLQW